MFLFPKSFYNKITLKIKGKKEIETVDFERYFQTVKPIILKLRRYYFVKLWDYEDWIQEGRIIFFELVEEHPDLLINEGKRYSYFKTKFSNHVKDIIRHQESFKRKFNRMQIRLPSVFNVLPIQMKRIVMWPFRLPKQINRAVAGKILRHKRTEIARQGVRYRL